MLGVAFVVEQKPLDLTVVSPAMDIESSPTEEPERIASAIFGPTPETDVSFANIAFSSSVAKPKRISSSSRTQ